ncbi:MAG: N-acetylglucosamine-6-phosphate deacetylase [Pseudomonadota bacterium]
MTGEWITAAGVFDGTDLRRDHAVQVQNGLAIAHRPRAALPANTPVRTVGHILTPAFFDIQVNGGGGVLFNTTPSAAGLRRIAAAHCALGTGAILPTVITDAPEVMEAATRAVIQAAGRDGIAGLHIEGPHIAAARHGTHDAAHIRPLDARTLAIVRDLRARNIPVLITLAPEATAPGQIAELAALGAVVSLGHTDAPLAQVRAAEAEGARLYTHLFNAMSPMLNRAPGVTGAAIRSSNYCSIIADGIHVAPEMLQIAIAARPVADRMILISDAMPTVGGPDGFTLYGKMVHLAEGRLVNGAGSLAGAHTWMAACLAYAVNRLGVVPETALRMALTNPARLMGLDAKFQLGTCHARRLLVLDKQMRAAPVPAAAALGSSAATS